MDNPLADWVICVRLVKVRLILWGDEMDDIVERLRNEEPDFEVYHLAADEIEQLRGQLQTRLRDEFAMAALTGMLAGRGEADRLHWAKMAYEFADDMVKERERTDG